MQKFTCKEYVEAFISNQTDREAWDRDYPDGLSMEDVCENDSVDVFHDCDDFIFDCGERMILTDGDPNFDTRYPI